MTLSARKATIGLVAALLLLAACNNGGASPSPSAGGTSSAPSPSQAAVATPVATVPAEQLTVAGHLTACIDIPYPPQEFFDADGNPTGADPDITTEIATRLGLATRIENTVFDTIIPALVAGKCDIIVSAQNITTDRLKTVNMIPYFKAGQAFVVAKGNPAGIKAELDLCGKKVAAETGTTEVDYVNGTGDYAGAGLNKKCADAGKAAVDLQELQKDSDALLALSSGQVDAYFADSPVAGYYTVQQPTQFELSGVTVEVALEGISVPKDRADLAAAVATALKSMVTDGKYVEILTKYGLEDGAVQASDVEVQTGS
ncbi:MAG: ABC transporter substrate-binding protein [Candidatus Limnocylindria bacterium]